MPELLKLETADWHLSVWCADIATKQAKFHKMLRQRKANIPVFELLCSLPSAHATSVICDGTNIEPASCANGAFKINLPHPIFFENTQYQFEWVFKSTAISHAQLEHRLKAVNDSFRFVRDKTQDRLTGVINTGNDLSWFKLPLRYELNGIQHKASISFEVLPLKMDMYRDLPAIYQEIDSTYPLWRFSLAQKTQHFAGKSSQLGYFPLFWLESFKALRLQFEYGLRVIASAPHNKLQDINLFKKADRVHGKMHHKLTEKISIDLQAGLTHKRYAVKLKKLSVDTPENRFIRMAVDTTAKRLGDFYQKLLQANATPEKQRLSDTFLNEIKSWQTPLLKMQKQAFMQEVGQYQGMAGESLVLQQKTGYNLVYRIWQELKFYLDVFSQQTSLSLKSVSEIYEVWCFLQIRKILVEQLGFVEKPITKATLVKSNFEYSLKDGMLGAFEFSRDDGVSLRLAHEPIFRKYSKEVRTYLIPQKPDILLEVTLADNKKILWIFDAKYRVKTQAELYDDVDVESMDFVPDDAINQMHRYRDALIHTQALSSTFAYNKSRPVIGAYALYPGFFDQTQANPYDDAIREIGIGAFALLPTDDGVGHMWLSNFLSEQLGKRYQYQTVQELNDALYVQSSTRIPFYGTKQVLYPDLTFTAALGNLTGRASDYLTRFEDGSAKWYHTPAVTFKQKFASSVIDELAYIAIGTISKGATTRSIKYLWRIKNVFIKPRSALTEEQAGSVKSSDELYYLFELSPALSLDALVDHMPTRSFSGSMKLSTLIALQKENDFRKIEQVYTQAIN